jgi:hypothetical protein
MVKKSTKTNIDLQNFAFACSMMKENQVWESLAKQKGGGHRIIIYRNKQNKKAQVVA